ncbi:SNF2 family N-terminal domain containing protein, partial [Aphelenchoides avenae]
IGGVGLTLTGADVVIFVDHDWNPVKDLQAIDRAHRLGQTRTVNVYRLITRGSIEEKIMRYQKFKSDTANVLVGADNKSLSSMATDELIELFSLGDNASSASTTTSEGPPGAKRQRKTAKQTGTAGAPGDVDATWALNELWDTSQYEEQHSVEAFVKNTRLQ